MNLKDARAQDKLDQFVSEREGEKGDKRALDRTVSAMAGKRAAQERPAS